MSSCSLRHAAAGTSLIALFLVTAQAIPAQPPEKEKPGQTAPAAPAGEDPAADADVSILAPEAGGLPSLFQDPGFEKYVDLQALAQGLADQDAELVCDVALQLAAGERTLLRSHKAVKAATVFDLALKFAVAKGDKATLARLGKAAETLKMDDLSTKLAQVRNLPPATRAVGPKVEIGTLTPGDVVGYEAYQKQILLAKSIGDKEDLEALKNGLADAELGDAVRKQIASEIEVALKNMPTPKSPEEVEALRALSGAARDSNKSSVQNSVRNGWNAVAWGKEITALEYAKLIAAMATGTVGLYLADLVRGSAATLGTNVVIQAIKNRGKTFGAGRFVCQAGIATYDNWRYIVIGPKGFQYKKKVNSPNTHQPYIRWKRT